MKKDSAARKSAEYFNLRVNTLEEYWTHAEIVKINEPTHEYWTGEYYKQIEKSYRDCFKYIQEATKCIKDSNEDRQVKHHMQLIQDLQQIMHRIDETLTPLEHTLDRYEILSEKLMNIIFSS
ncbi:unnamed protein product [Brassicogethes aeneus]|uniref:Uncharacterized protein n=1 Tax=Brassicogethes aeneus TaxID=1431903 RepID=A0A9P0B0A3_BRAAE|nr:unnamed protein product [Brassicogethes aeneus]